MHASERLVRILTGLIAIVTMAAVTVVAVEFSTGHFARAYTLRATFDAAGQGLIEKSDVKVRGFTVGQVAGVHLRAGRAVVSLRIHGGEHIPVASKAVVRAKTLFGEKFVDIDVGDERPPYLHNGGIIASATGGFELEQVLTDAEPLLRALDPADVTTVLGTLADASSGEGAAINRQIAADARLAEVFARHADDTRAFLDSLDRLSAALERGAPSAVGAARDLNVALPALNAQGPQLDPFLDGVATLSRRLAEVLEVNRSALVTAARDGTKPLGVLFDHRDRIGPLLVGLQEFFQTIAEADRYAGTAPFASGDGTHLAPVKLVLGGGPPTGRAAGAARGTSGPGAAASAVHRSPAPTRGAAAVADLLGRALGVSR